MPTVFSVNSLALVTSVAVLGICTTSLLLPVSATLPSLLQDNTGRQLDQAPSAKQPLLLQVGHLQVRWVPKVSEASLESQTLDQSPVAGTGTLMRAAIIVAVSVIFICLVNFVHSLFEEHKQEVAGLKALIFALEAEKRRSASMVEAELESLRMENGEQENLLRANALALAFAKTINKMEARGEYMALSSAFKAWNADAKSLKQNAESLLKDVEARESKRKSDELLRKQILGSLSNSVLNAGTPY